MNLSVTNSHEAEIAVIHPNLNMKGGSEAVCMNVLEALQEDYSVTLITITPPDFEGLNKFFGTSVEEVSVNKDIGTLLSIFRSILSLTQIFELSALSNSLLSRHTKDLQQSFDLVISTKEEIGFHSRAVQYIHFPRQGVIVEEGRDEIPGQEESNSSLYQAYDAVCRLIAGYSRRRISEDRLLVNSQWTANIVECIYNRTPEVVYPPIDNRGFTDIKWEHRENGFVAIGRLCPGKRVSRTIKIIDELHDWNDNIHLHLIGPIDDTLYSDHIKQAAESREYIYLEGECSRTELIDMIQRHRYGIHGKEFEHFGMAVAEMVTGGAIPFVPNSGGQTDIVRNDDRLLYNNIDNAVMKIRAVLEYPDEQQSLRSMLRDSSDRFTRERFHQRIQSVISEELDQTDSTT